MAERHALAVTNASLHGSCLSFSAGLLDHLRVELYGDHMPMKACGTATVRDPQLLVFNAFDPSVGGSWAQNVLWVAVELWPPDVICYLGLPVCALNRPLHQHIGGFTLFPFIARRRVRPSPRPSAILRWASTPGWRARTSWSPCRGRTWGGVGAAARRVPGDEIRLCSIT